MELLVILSVMVVIIICAVSFSKEYLKEKEMQELQDKVDAKRFYEEHGCSREELIEKLCSEENIERLANELGRIAADYTPERVYFKKTDYPYTKTQYWICSFQYSSKAQLSMELNNVTPIAQIKIADYVQFLDFGGPCCRPFLNKFILTLLDSNPTLNERYYIFDESLRLKDNYKI